MKNEENSEKVKEPNTGAKRSAEKIGDYHHGEEKLLFTEGDVVEGRVSFRRFCVQFEYSPNSSIAQSAYVMAAALTVS